jgi:transketolase
MGLDPLADKFAAFGWAVRETDGNDPGALLETFAGLPFEPGKPSCIIANTTKGRGVSFIEDRAAWHHRVPSDEEYAQAVAELKGSRA